MKQILKAELSRAIKNRGMLLALTIGIGIALVHAVHVMLPAYYVNLETDFERYPILYPAIVADTWLAGNEFALESFLYFLVLPLVAVLPFGTSYFSDKENGFLKSLYMRVSRKDYLLAKYAAAFVSGGIASVVPLIVNLLCAFILLPNLCPEVVMPHNGISATNLFYEIYYANPILYIFIFLCIDFVAGGIFACMALACSYLSDYKIIIAICPFFIQLILHVGSSMLMKLDYSSVYFLEAGYGIRAPLVAILCMILGLGLSFAVFVKKGEKEDVF